MSDHRERANDNRAVARIWVWPRHFVISAIWELPLAVLSRLALVVVRFCLRKLARLHYRRAGDEAIVWRLLDEQLLQQRYALPVVMTEGPRWNTHAVIGRVGPLTVRDHIEVQTAQANTSASSWTIVVYSFPDHRTIATLGPEDATPNRQWADVALEEGRYSLILRYYQPTAAATLPAIRVDGQPVVASASIPDAANGFYEQLPQRRSMFYVILHYHAYVALKYRRCLPDRFVERIYLPVGNPETLFRYGALQARDCLQLVITEKFLDDWDVYVTVYDIASFPIVWQTVDAKECQLGPFGRQCTFLIRVHRRSAASPPPSDDDVRIRITLS